MNRRVRGLGIAILTALLGAACAESDAGITTKVKARLDAQRDLTSTSIQVATADHVVTLSGTTANEGERQKAIEVAKGTEGVKDVVDKLSLAPASPTPASPAPAAPAPAAPEPLSPEPAVSPAPAPAR